MRDHWELKNKTKENTLDKHPLLGREKKERDSTNIVKIEKIGLKQSSEHTYHVQHNN